MKCNWCGRFMNKGYVYTSFGTYLDREPPDDKYICDKCFTPENEKSLKNQWRKPRRIDYERLEKKLKPSIPLVYCKEHKTICTPLGGKLACCLEARIKELEEGIEKVLDVFYKYPLAIINQEKELKRLKKLIGKEE